MLPKLIIRYYGDPCLRKKSAEVKSVGPGERMFIKALQGAMYEHKGVGLAAPQVGINQQIFVADPGNGVGPLVFINPKIVKKSGSHKMAEGCLSIPGVSISVKRSQKIYVKYLDENNQQKEAEFTDFLARILQHEYDHLQGKLIVDYASMTAKLKFRKTLADLKEGKLKPDVVSNPS